MLASVFVADGVDALRHPQEHAARFRKAQGYLEKAGLPPAVTADAVMLTRITGAVSVISGLMLATGRRPRSAALTLAVINIPMTVLNNPVWEASGKEERKRYLSGLLRGLGLGGGLLLAAADLAGRPSMGWRLANAREHRADLRETKVALKERYKD